MFITECWCLYNNVTFTFNVNCKTDGTREHEKQTSYLVYIIDAMYFDLMMHNWASEASPHTSESQLRSDTYMFISSKVQR